MTIATKSRSGYDITPLSPGRRDEYAQALTAEEQKAEEVAKRKAVLEAHLRHLLTGYVRR